MEIARLTLMTWVVIVLLVNNSLVYNFFHVSGELEDNAREIAGVLSF